MATAILTVLYPEEFTVYDVRACDALGDFHNIRNRTNPVRIWEGYKEFREAVRKETPSYLSLRDKDRWLWAKAVVEQMESDLRNGFKKTGGVKLALVNVRASCNGPIPSGRHP